MGKERRDSTTIIRRRPGLFPDTPNVSLLLYHRHGSRMETLSEGECVVVGRDQPADVLIPDGSLSRQHARFEWVDSELWVEDLGSTNGTWLNGHRVDGRRRVMIGDHVQMGALLASLHVVEASSDAPYELLGHDPFMVALEEEVIRAHTLRHPIGVLMIEAQTSAKGHLDRWYPRVRRLLRPVDRSALYGPNALLVSLPEADFEYAVRLARSVVGQQADGEPQLRAGVVAYPEWGTTAEALIESLRVTTRAAPAGQVSAGRPLPPSAGTLEGDAPVVLSEAMRQVYQTVDRIADSHLHVLILGETGSGKEVLAAEIHRRSGRCERQLCSVNCGAIPESLLESTLFGHERGAFTGADQSKAGLFEAADGGTVLLDEVGELSPSAQAALLRVIETRSLLRVGGSEPIEADVRVIAATHRDLEAMCDEGAFRWDLYYRLNGVSLKLAPLRQRTEEIAPLAERFLAKAAESNRRTVHRISEQARAALMRYSWPGNVRELRNVIERAVVIAIGDEVTVDDLSERVRQVAPVNALPPPLPPSNEQQPLDGDVIKDRLRDYETQLLVQALRANDWNQTQTAQALGMPLRTLVRRIQKLDIKRG